MSDTPLPDPLDEQASDLLDAGDDAPADRADLEARLDDFRTLRARLADVPGPDPEARERSIAAALVAFDDLLADTDETDDTDAAEVAPLGPDVEPEVGVVPVTELATRAARRPSRSRRWFPIVGSAAAVVVVLLGIAALVGGGSDQKLSSSAPRSDKAAGNASAITAEAGAATASGTVAGAATTGAATGGFTPDPPAADGNGGATTTAAAGGAATTFATAAAAPSVGETTSTIDVRDVTTTVAAASTTAPPPSTTTTTVDPTLLPYLGEFTTTDALAVALRQPPAVDPTDDGRTIRTQLAEGSCDIVPFGEPVGVLRWNGRDAVAVRSATGPFVQVIPLDGCNPIALLDAPA